MAWMDLIRKVVVFDRTFGAADSFLPITKARKPTAANTAKYKMSCISPILFAASDSGRRSCPG